MSPTSLRAQKGRGDSYVDVDFRPHGGHTKLVDAVGSGRRVLDVGCSTGYLAEALVRRGNRVVGVESDPTAAAWAREWCDEVVVGDVDTFEPPATLGLFDVLLCADVIEHLRDPRSFLLRSRSLLRRDGRLVLSTPNIANWSIRAALLAGRFRYTERGILDQTHTHLFTRRTLIECLHGAGYQLDAIDFTIPVPLIGTDAVEAMAHAIGCLRPTLFAYQFVVTASVAE
jgi:2-polyprenyl-3-methyl-5-hydroxy-6-metoxy-1,4-benzoquinol methylase